MSEKDFFKLMNNAVFGKTMETLRKRLIVQLVNNQSIARKLTSKPTFDAFRIFNEDLVAVHMSKQRLYLNRYVGFTILDVSKTLMYDFH
jgi:translation initiation factor IF-1